MLTRDAVALQIPSTGPTVRSSPRRSWPGLFLFGLPVVLAVLLRGYQLSRPGALFGVTNWDDGAYLGQIFRLLDGVAPYRAFAVVEPPGLMVVLAPFVAIFRFLGTDDVLAAVRILTNVVDIANVVLIGAVIRHRGRLASVVAMFGAAIFPAALSADATLFLEPYLNFFCLLAMLTLFREGEVAGGRRPFVAGVFLGVAGTVKIFAIFPLLGLVAVLVRSDRRSLAHVVAGSALSFGLISVPFAALAPGSFFRGAVWVQLFRTTPGRSGIGPRLTSAIGLSSFNLPDGVEVAVGGVVLLALALVVVWQRRHLCPLELFGFVTSAFVLAATLFTANFVEHYADFLVPFLIVGVAGLVGRRHPGLTRRRLTGALALFAAIVVASDLGALSKESPAYTSGGGTIPVPAGACVLTDSPANLIAADHFTTRPGCPVFVDTFGATLVMADARDPLTIDKEDDPRISAAWEQLFGRASYIVWTGWHGVDMPATTLFLGWFHRNFVLVEPLPQGGELLYRHR